MSNFRLFWLIVRQCQLEKLLTLFVISFFAVAGVILAAEPHIDKYGDALWYTFVASTTIGFGDIVVTTPAGRICTIFITVFGIVLAALLSGVVVSHYLEVINRREKLTATMFVDKLTHLRQLTDQDLKEIEDKVRAIKGTLNQ